MAVATELVTRFGFEGSSQPLQEYNQGLATGITRLGAFAAAAVAAVGAAFAFTSAQAGPKKEAMAMADALGLSVQRMQELEQVAQNANASQGALTSTLQSLNDAIADSKFGNYNEGLVIAGINTRKANGEFKNSEELLNDVSDRLVDLDRVGQVNLLNSLGIDQSMLGLLRMSSKGIQDQVNGLRDFGTLTKKDLSSLKDYNRSVGDLQFGFGRMKDSIAIALAPALADLADKFSSWLKSPEFKDFVQAFSAGMSGIISFVSRFAKEIAGLLVFVAGVKGLVIVFKFLKIAFRLIRFPILLAFLAIKDFINFISGKDSIIGNLAASLGRVWEGLKKLQKSQWEKVKEGVNIAIESFKNFRDNVLGWFDEIINKIGNVGSAIKDKITGNITGAVQSVSGFLGFGGDDAEVRASSVNPRAGSTTSVINNNSVNIPISGSNAQDIARRTIEGFQGAIGDFEQQSSGLRVQ